MGFSGERRLHPIKKRKKGGFVLAKDIVILQGHQGMEENLEKNVGPEADGCELARNQESSAHQNNEVTARQWVWEEETTCF